MVHILLPTDFSAAAFNAIQFAIDLYGTRNVRYTLVNTYLQQAFDHALLPDLSVGMRHASEKGLRAVERKCRKYATGISVAKYSTAEHLPAALNHLCTKKRADLIVMGTQGEGNYGFVGSNTKAVVLGSTAPVITVPSFWTARPISRILLAHDGNDIDRGTLEPLERLALRANSHVVVTHVRDNIATFEKPMDRKTMTAALGRIPHSFLTVQGDAVVSTLNDLASKDKAQLVAMVHRQRGFWQKLFHTSKTKNMAMHTELPVLVLRQKAH
jgi:nucleotide-binding universal stress UspA family protein